MSAGRFVLRALFGAVAALSLENAQAATSKLPSFISEVRSEATFKAIANAEPGGVMRAGSVVKFLIDNREYPKAAPLVYVNGNYCDESGCPAKFVQLHRTFGEKMLKHFHYDNPAFSELTYFTNDLKKKQFIAGRVQTFERDGKVFYGIWFVEFDEISEETIQFAVEKVKKTFSIPGAELAFVAYGSQQKTDRIKPWLDKNSVNVYTIGSLIADLKVLPLNNGEAWGFLRVFPKDADDLDATEIAVFNELPLDLAVVAGTVTTAFQDVSSHVNLKSKERGTPNIVIREEKRIEDLKAMDGQPVHLKVTDDGYSIEPTTPALVQRKFEEKINRPWKVSPADMSDKILQTDEMCRGQDPKVCLNYGKRYGGKASRLGFLAHEKVIGEGSALRKKFGYRLSPLGFGMPVRLYKDFVDYNAKINPAFKKAIDDLINTEMGTDGAAPLNTEGKKAKIAEIKALFLNGVFPPGTAERLNAEMLKLKANVAAAYPGEDLNKLKIRSSANVEDIDDFNGAGLHDSFSAKIKKSDAATADQACSIVAKAGEDDNEVKEEVLPASLYCAIKGTYASLWNLRAVRERTFRRFDHRSAMMGLAVIPAYKFREKPKQKIVANSVLVTRVLNTNTVYGYQLSTQKGNNLVTNPDAGTVAELATLAFHLATTPRVTVLRNATPDPKEPALSKTVLSNEKMIEIVKIGRTIEEAYCAAKPDYFPGGKCAAVSNSSKKPKALDMEVKIYDNGEVAFKQFREFSGR